jgi:beta-barrel assembly-enhancing protease
MKHWIAFAGILLMGIAAVVVTERRKVDVPPDPAAVLYLVADTEQELTRMPVSFTRMSDQEEIAIGEELASRYSSGPNGAKDPETVKIEQYLTEVGSRLTPHAHRKLPYKFHFLRDRNMINAFALPGGHVFVGGGLLSLMDSEDELAAVLGHEIEHIDHYHCAQRIQQQKALHQIPFGGLVEIPLEVFEAGYSKDQELEADREGTRLSVESGYSANGAIRMFETFQRLFQEYRVQARTPQEEVTNLTLQTLEGYFRSHPLPSERIKQIQQLIASEHWEARPERDLAVGYIFWTEEAKTALDAKNYQRAQQLATRSLKGRPGREDALRILAQSEFAQANFAAAADSYRNILDLYKNEIAVDNAYLYARALAASDRTTALTKFRQWEGSLKIEKPKELEIPLAGLSLLAGEPGPARTAAAAANNNIEASWAPDALANLGWWYYLAGDYTTAQTLLNNAVQQRPGDTGVTTELAWMQIENRKLADAMQTLTPNYDSNTLPDRAMAAAVGFWQARQPDQAIAEFESAIAHQPEWLNEHWVRALYSPRVAQSVLEIQAEKLRREKARAAEKR